jgi:serine/threonine protein kinase
MWSVACVIIEMLHGLPLFIGENSLDHLLEVIKVVGTPSKQEVLQMNPNYDISEYDLPVIKRKSFSRLFPKADLKLIDLVNKLMIYNPHERLSAIEALAHNYFDELRNEDNFKILESYISQEKLEKMYDFSEKEIELYNTTSEDRKKASKSYTKNAEPTSSKQPSEMA